MIQPTLNIESPELNVDKMLHGIEYKVYQRTNSWAVPYTFSGKSGILRLGIVISGHGITVRI